jgi:tetratricopeptide (TPR) repeat protein
MEGVNILSKKLCSSCGAEGTSVRCPCRGGHSLYCGRRCQKAHWDEHKKTCTVALGNALVAMRSERGNCDIMVAEAAFCISGIFSDNCDYENAEKSLLEALLISRFRLEECVNAFRLGNCAKCLQMICHIYLSQGRNEEARKMGLDALRIARVTDGDDSVAVARALNSIAGTCQTQDKYTEAVEILEECLRIFRAVHETDNHSDVVMVLGNLADIYESVGKPEEALKRYMEVTRITRRLYGNDTTNVLQSLEGRATICVRLCRLDEALVILNEALTLSHREHGLKHPLVSRLLQRIGQVFGHQDKFDDALRVLKKALSYQQRALVTGHGDVTGQRDVATTINCIAVVRLKREDFRKALIGFEKAEAIFRSWCRSP